jgi:hypothetical protein
MTYLTTYLRSNYQTCFSSLRLNSLQDLALTGGAFVSTWLAGALVSRHALVQSASNSLKYKASSISLAPASPMRTHICSLTLLVHAALRY